jgi:hypothetical protein
VPRLIDRAGHSLPKLIDDSLGHRDSLRPIPEPRDARRRRILDLEPGLRRSRPIGTHAVLGDDALRSEPAGGSEEGRAVALQMFVVPHDGLAPELAGMRKDTNVVTDGTE